MNNLILEATSNTPAVMFSESGIFEMRGRFITENAYITFEPLFQWIRQFEGKNVKFTIELDYINTSATMQLFSLLRTIDENMGIASVEVNWCYDEYDDDLLETGEFYAEKLSRVHFEYNSIEEAA